VAGETEGVGLLPEQAAVPGLVGLMTDIALAFGKGSVRHLRLPGQILVAGKTPFSQGNPEQAGMIGAVGRMALQAFSIPHRLVHLPLAVLRFRPLVAAIAEFGALVLEQARIPGRMRIVALPALALGHRPMIVPGAEVLALVAGEAGFLGRDRGRESGKAGQAG
jgi:hypothetical protein